MQINATIQTGTPTSIINAINTAISYFDSTILNNFTVNITFDYSSLSSGSVGQSSAVYYYGISYATLKQDLTANAVTADSKLAAASLPSADPFNTVLSTYPNYVYIPTAMIKMLGDTGITITSGASDGTITLNSNMDYSSNGVDPVGTIEHEISEILGRNDGSDGSLGVSSVATIADFYRYSSPGVIDTSSSYANAFFSLDGQTMLKQLGEQGDDLADWATAITGDPFGVAVYGVEDAISAVDLQTLSALGYDIASPTAVAITTANTSLNAANGAVITVANALSQVTINGGNNSIALGANDGGAGVFITGLGGDNIALQANDVVTLSATNEILNGNQSVVNIQQGSNSDYVNGNNDTIALAASLLRVTGAGDVVNALAGMNGSVITVGGNGQAGADDVLNIGPRSVTELANSAIIVNGSTVTINTSQNDNLGVSGAGDTVYLAGGDNIWIGLNGKAGTQDTVIVNGIGGYVSVASSSNVTVDGSEMIVEAGQQDNLVLEGIADTAYLDGTGDSVLAWFSGTNINGNGATVTALQNVNLGVYGSNDTINMTNTGNGVWVGLNGQSGVADTVNFTSTGSVAEAANSAIIVNGSGVYVLAASSDNLGLFGAGDTVTLTGAGDGVWVGLNGQSGVADTLNFAGTGYVSEAANSAVIVNGNGVYVAAGQNDNLGLFGANDTAALSGAGDGVWVSGTADTLNFTSTGYVSEGANSAITVNGNGVYVAAGSSDNLGLFGAGNTAAFSGSGDNVWVGGNGQTGAVDTLNFTQGGGVSEGANANIAINGNGATVVMGQNDTATFAGTNETAVITSGFGTEIIGGFQATGTAHDSLQIATNIFADWAHLLGATTQQGSDLVITLDASDTITLKGLTLTAGQANSFTSTDVHFG